MSTRTSTSELWDAVSRQGDLVESLQATRQAWADAGKTDMVADANRAIEHELAKLGALTHTYNERVLTGV